MIPIVLFELNESTDKRKWRKTGWKVTVQIPPPSSGVSELLLFLLVLQFPQSCF